MSRDDPDFIDSVDKALRVLESFSAEEPHLTISRAATLAGVTRATARRLLLTFQRLGMLEATEAGFKLTPRVLRIGYGYLSALPLWDLTQTRLRALAESVNETCSAATIDDTEIVYVARVPARHSMGLTLTIGSRLPAYPTSMGRVLLAGLSPERFDEYMGRVTLRRLTPRTETDPARFRAIIDEVRAVGHALVDEEREIGVRSAAAPLKGRGSQVLAAINVSVNAARVSRRHLEQVVVPELVAAAEEISSNLNHLSPTELNSHVPA